MKKNGILLHILIKNKFERFLQKVIKNFNQNQKIKYITWIAEIRNILYNIYNNISAN